MQRAPFFLSIGTGAVVLAAFLFDANSLSSAAGPSEPVPYFGVFRELPITDIKPKGWLAEWLTRQRDGLASHPEASDWPFTSCMWGGKIPHAHWEDYEQTGYFVDGVYRAGLLLGDGPLIQRGEESVKFVLDHPQANGQLGPSLEEVNLKPSDATGETAKIPPATQWPMAVFTRALMANYAVTGDRRILDALTKHYLSLPAYFGNRDRDVCNVEGMCWLYEQTGDPRILDLAEKTWKNLKSLPPGQYELSKLTRALPLKAHGVTACELTKQPALLFLATGRKAYLDASLGGFTSMARDHELVDGVISSDEGLHGRKAESLHETCDISDYTWSLGYLLMATGDGMWGDKIERAILNAGFGAVDKDFKAHQYFSSPNQMISTQTSAIARFGPQHADRQAYCPSFVTQCCTGNVERMIPNYAARLWMGDNQGGLAATLYGPNTVKTKAGADGTPVTFVEKTDYPFNGMVELTFTADKPVRFPLYLRIPGWAEGATVTVNDKPVADTPKPGTFLKIDRTFASGDVVKLNLPMNVRLETPVAGGLSVVRGPLVYSLKIQENRVKGTNARATAPGFPAWDITAGSAWNYGLDLKGPEDVSKIKVSTKPISGFPWTPDSSPVVLTAPARQIPSWTLTQDGKNPALPTAPFELAAKTEEVELIPDGATHLRVSVFPDLKAPSAK